MKTCTFPKEAKIETNGRHVVVASESTSVMIALRPQVYTGETRLAYLGYIPPNTIINPDVFFSEYASWFLHVATGRGQCTVQDVRGIESEGLYETMQERAREEIARRHRRAHERVANALLHSASRELEFAWFIKNTLEDQRSPELWIHIVELSGMVPISRESIGRILKRWQHRGLFTRSAFKKNICTFDEDALDNRIETLREEATECVSRRSWPPGLAYWD